MLYNAFNMTKLPKILFIITLITFSIILYYLFFIPDFIFAQEMSSQNFRIQSGNLNMTSGSKSSANYQLSDVVGQNAATVFTSKGYIIQSGFLNSAAGSVFSLSIQPQYIDFGNILPNSPVEKTVQITIANGDVPGYSITVAQNQPLQTSAGAQISNTVCDNNAKPCTTTKAAIWETPGIYGFGYNISGNSIARDFLDEKYFRPFADLSKKENPATIMLSQQRKVVDQTTMRLKLHISPDQPVGQYKNSLNFTAIAGI